MPQRLRPLVALIALLTIVPTTPALTKERTPIKTIGIVTLVEPNFHLTDIGFFKGENETVDASAWKLEAFARERFAARLAPRYELRSVPYGQGQIIVALSGFMGPNFGKYIREGVPEAERQGIDAYLVIWTKVQEDFITMSNRLLYGCGILNHDGEWIYAAANMTLVDGGTFRELDDCDMEAPRQGRRGTAWYRKVSGLWADTFAAMTPAQKTALETGTKDLLAGGIDHCLQELKLLQ